MRLTAALVLLLIASPALAGAWTEKAGEGEVIVTLRGSVASSRFDGAGDRVPGSFSKHEVDVYASHGLTDALTAILHPDFAWADGETGFDRTELGLKYRIWSNSVSVASIQGSVFIPGTLNGGEGWGAELSALYGRNLKLSGHDAFANAELAYRHLRDRGEVRADLTFGWRADENWLLLAQSFLTLSTWSDGGAAASDQWKLQGSVARKLTSQITLQLGVGATVLGRNTPVERYAFTGIWLRY